MSNHKEILAVARADYDTAAREWREAESRWLEARQEKKAAFEKLTKRFDPQKEIGLQIKEREADKDTARIASVREAEARSAERTAYALRSVARDNVAVAAANLVLQALLEDEVMRNIPPHYRKFEKYIKNLLGDEFSTDTAYGYLRVLFLYAPAYVCETIGEKPHMPETPEYKHVATYDEMKGEVDRAAACTCELESTFRKMQERLDRERETYKTAARDLLPCIKEAALNLGYNYIRPEI